MTREMIDRERTAINDAVAARAVKKEQAAGVRKGLFGFAKGIAAAMVPGAALPGSGPTIAALAAQGASRSAAQMLDRSHIAPKPAPPAEPTTEQQARLARLDAIGVDRNCAA